MRNSERSVGLLLFNFTAGILMADTKEIIDIAAASTGVLSLAAWLPPTASLFTIVWLGIRILETETVQGLLGKKKD